MHYRHRKIQSLRRSAYLHQRGRCCYCGVRMWQRDPAELGVAATLPSASKLQCTAEHLQPRSMGGPDRRENIAACCAHCNGLRHRTRVVLDPDAYREEVVKRVESRTWHLPWVHETGLLGPTP